jgi:putative transcriptional regulator
MTHKLRGCGLPNVYLTSGYVTKDEGEFKTVAYEDLDGLYRQIARAISLRAGPLSSNELRFLRKRLLQSQAEVGALGNKTEQAVAKWEKGTASVPKAESNLLRIVVLTKLRFKADIARVVEQLAMDESVTASPYYFSFFNGVWTEDSAASQADVEATHRIASDAIFTACEASKTSSRWYTLAPSATSGKPIKVRCRDLQEDGGKIV